MAYRKKELTAHVATNADHSASLSLLIVGAFQQHPRLLGLQVLVSMPRHGQQMPKTITEFRSFHCLQVAFNLSIDQCDQNGFVSAQYNWRNGGVKVFLTKDQRAINEIAQIVQQFRIVSCHQIVPAKVRVLSFGSCRGQIETPNVGSNASVLGIIAEHSDASALAELAVFIVQIFGGHQMRNNCVTLVQTEQRRREHDRMEGNIVLGHELVQVNLDIFVFRLPPLSPFLCVPCRYRNVSNRSIEPHIKHFRLETGIRHRNAPFQVTRYATRTQPFP